MRQKIRLVTPLERTLYLKALEPLQGLASEDLAHIAQDAEERYFRRGDRLFRRGEPVTEVHIITDGSVRLSGADFATVTRHERDSIGGLSLLARSEEGIDAVAETEVRTLMIKDQVLFDVFEDNFRVLHNQILSLARSTLELRRNIQDGTYLSPAEEQNLEIKQNMDLAERVLFMRLGPGFRQSNVNAVIQLAISFVESQLDTGTKLWKIGDHAGFMHVIVKGTVRCTLADGTHFRAGPGYPLGNLESQALVPRWYEAVAETPLTVLSGSTDAFIDVLEDHTSMAMDFLSAMARNLVQMLRAPSRSRGDSEAA